MFSLILKLLIFASVAVPGLGELFTSIAHLQTALYAERDIAEEIREYIKREEEKLNNLKSIAEEFESHSSAALQNTHVYLGNPVNAYLFVKHFTLDWDRNIDHILKNNSKQELTEKVEILKQYLPTYEDLQGTVSALLRLQDVYKLDTSDIARGDVGGVSSTELTAEDCFELGRLSYNSEDHYHTIMWMEEALRKNREMEEPSVDTAEILDYLAFSTYMQGNVRRALSLTNELLELEPDHSRAEQNKYFYEKIIQEEEQNSRKRGDDGQVPASNEFVNKRQLDEYRTSEEFSNYEALCRGEDTMAVKDRHRLYCRYVTNNSPELLLSPAKEEILHFNPFLAVYHNIISDQEIDTVKELAMPKLGRATVHNAKTGKLETASYRVSKSCWLNDNDSPVILGANRRVEAITGLNMKTAEELQISNYGVGGQYEPHFDFARKEEKNAFQSLGTGNRIATWMYYMSDVEAGGATVFPYLGLKVFPEKGKAVFWYNLFKNGEGIYDTRHAACPVLVGDKWVANKWVHERGQEFRRPCSLRANQ